MTHKSMWSLGFHGKIDEISRRLATGTDIDECNKDGDTALFGAIHYGFAWSDTLQFLIDKGADMNIQNTSGNTPIHVLQYYVQSDGIAVRMLVEAGCRTDIRVDGYTPLEYSIKTNKTMITSYLELRSRENVLLALTTYDDDVPMVLFELIADFVTSV